MKTWVTGELITADDLNTIMRVVDDLSERVGRLATIVERVRLSNHSVGAGPPAGRAPEGWIYVDRLSGDTYRAAPGAGWVRERHGDGPSGESPADETEEE